MAGVSRSIYTQNKTGWRCPPVKCGRLDTSGWKERILQYHQGRDPKGMERKL